MISGDLVSKYSKLSQKNLDVWSEITTLPDLTLGPPAPHIEICPFLVNFDQKWAILPLLYLVCRKNSKFSHFRWFLVVWSQITPILAQKWDFWSEIITFPDLTLGPRAPHIEICPFFGQFWPKMGPFDPYYIPFLVKTQNFRILGDLWWFGIKIVLF